MSVDPEKTEEILKRIAAMEAAEAAVPPPPFIHSTPTRMAQPHAVRVGVAMLGTRVNNVLRAACTFAIAQCRS